MSQESCGPNGRDIENPWVESEEIVIAVMGATGSGKSTFINLLSGSDLAVSNGLTSCTSNIEIANTFELDGRMITLIDTPGFDDTTKSDTDILKMLAVFLSSTYKCGRKLSGLIYMHRISDFKVGGISRRNFNMFRKLCGDETLSNVVIVTNMWGQVSLDVGEERERELRTNDLLFAPALQKGASMLRHDNTLGSAQTILRHIVDNEPKALRIQRELVDEGKGISETAAGIELDSELEIMRKRHIEELAEVRKEMEEALALKDEEMRKELEAVRRDLLRYIQKIERDRARLSKEFAEEKAKADARIRKIQEDLDAEKAARLGRAQGIPRVIEAKKGDGTSRQLASALVAPSGLFARLALTLGRLLWQ